MEVSALQTEAEAITLSAPWRAPLLSPSREMESLKVSFPVKAVQRCHQRAGFLLQMEMHSVSIWTVRPRQSNEEETRK